ncbi:hypothetical protein [Bradyrhizobium sp. LTSP849]|uniref:hypothetical protein n=1 Tax=Bradyrhizobium sp. LTSP849 TaxID=1615890 RepID=UPI0006793EBB|nr:hypothetical protein [Bradyrhizobium sp. LTSP849]
MTDKKKPAPRTSVPQSGYASTLARLASFGLGAKKKAEEDDENEDDKAEDEEDGKAKKKGKARSKDNDDDVDPDSDDDEELDDDDADDEDEDDKKDKKASAARGRERGRISAIINSRAAQRSDTHRAMAMNLALSTELTRAEAIIVLNQTPAPAKPAGQAARDRLNTAPNPDVGSGDGGNGSGPTLAQQVIAAGKKRRGEI